MSVEDLHVPDSSRQPENFGPMSWRPQRHGKRETLGSKWILAAEATAETVVVALSLRGTEEGMHPTGWCCDVNDDTDVVDGTCCTSA